MADKDYSATPLSQKLGAKPGAGVVVFFTTSRVDLEGRFDGLKATLDRAEGLWIAWPKRRRLVSTRTCRSKASRRSASHTAGRQQVMLDRRALAGASFRVSAGGSVKSW
ncbi:MAG: hypothetical protein ACR2G9_04640 [Gaiellaceae bacterium]